MTTIAFCLMSYFNSVFNVLFLRLQKSEDDICLWCHMLTNFIRQISDFNLINWREETEKGETTGTLDYLFWSLKFLELQANHQQQHGRSERWEWDESAEHNSAHNNSCSIISNYYRSLVDPISEGSGQHKQSKKELKTTDLNRFKIGGKIDKESCLLVAVVAVHSSNNKLITRKWRRRAGF